MERVTMDTKTTPSKSFSEALKDEFLESIDEELELEFDDQRLDSVLGPGRASPHETDAPISENCCDYSEN
jgi:hypothetical protein